jgi:hypothetical protein
VLLSEVGDGEGTCAYPEANWNSDHSNRRRFYRKDKAPH